MKKITYLPYQKVGEMIFLTEVEALETPGGQLKRRALFECKCGNTITALIDNVKRLKIVSCECIKKDRMKLLNYSHGLYDSPLHSVWTNMKTRCYNPKTWNFKNYGGRGIRVCDEWLNDFKSFHNWAIKNNYTQGLQLDRINNDGDYSPDNCRFVTAKENCQNRIRKDHNEAYIF